MADFKMKNTIDTMSLQDLRGELEKLKKKSQRTELLLTINRKIAGLTDLTEVLFKIIDELVFELNAERGSLFLNDPLTGELYSRIAQGELAREIRFLNTSGIAGSIYHAGVGEIIHDVTNDERFNKSIDERTGFKTRNIICIPIQTTQDDVIGVVQVLNKKKGRFTKSDLEMAKGSNTNHCREKKRSFLLN
jgi:adenylate cyclase